MTLASTHVFGRQVLARVWASVTGQDPSLAELQIAGAVANLETSYGRGWQGEMAGSHNWGAIACHNPAMGCAHAQDSSPGKPLETRKFQTYPDDDTGAMDLVHELTLKRPRSWAAMKAGDIDGFSAAMHGDTGDPLYYEGTSTDPGVNVDRHAHKVEEGVRAIADAMGEAVMATRGGGAASAEDPLPPSYS